MSKDVREPRSTCHIFDSSLRCNDSVGLAKANEALILGKTLKAPELLQTGFIKYVFLIMIPSGYLTPNEQ